MTEPVPASVFNPNSLDGINLVLLDRDGVINHDSEAYIKGPGEWQPLPGSLQAIVDLQAHVAVAVCTNQSGLGRGLFDDHALMAIHEKFALALRHVGGEAVNVYFCPHSPQAGCDCRKPAPGLLTTAMHDLTKTPEETVFVGDSARDLEAAEACGCLPVLVTTGNGRQTAETYPTQAPVFEDLAAFTQALITRRG